MGLDESSELGECPQCKAFVEANGEIGKSKLFADHVNWIANFHFEQGKRPIMWGDMLIQYPECIPEIDKRIIICDWEYDTTGESFPNVNYFLGQGFSVITAPAVQDTRETLLCPKYAQSIPNITKFNQLCSERGMLRLNLHQLGNSEFSMANAAIRLFSACTHHMESKIFRPIEICNDILDKLFRAVI